MDADMTKKLDQLEATAKALMAQQITVNDPGYRKLLASCMDVLDSKGQDYTIGSQDRLHNFRTVAEFTGLTMEQVLGVYFYKHIAAVFAFIKNGGQSESEPIEGRITDVINYMLLFSKMVAERKQIPKAVLTSCGAPLPLGMDFALPVATNQPYASLAEASGFEDHQ